MENRKKIRSMSDISQYTQSSNKFTKTNSFMNTAICSFIGDKKKSNALTLSTKKHYRNKSNYQLGPFKVIHKLPLEVGILNQQVTSRKVYRPPTRKQTPQIKCTLGLSNVQEDCKRPVSQKQRRCGVIPIVVTSEAGCNRGNASIRLGNSSLDRDFLDMFA